MKAVKIISGVVIAGVLALVYFAIQAEKNAEYWQNYRKTEPARQARHNKKEETEPAPEPTEPQTEGQ